MTGNSSSQTVPLANVRVDALSLVLWSIAGILIALGYTSSLRIIAVPLVLIVAAVAAHRTLAPAHATAVQAAAGIALVAVFAGPGRDTNDADAFVVAGALLAGASLLLFVLTRTARIQPVCLAQTLLGVVLMSPSFETPAFLAGAVLAMTAATIWALSRTDRRARAALLALTVVNAVAIGMANLHG